MTPPAVAARSSIGFQPRVNGALISAWLIGFAPVLYLGLDGGGYDVIVRSQIGVAVWWLVLVCVLAGALPVVVPSRLGALAVGLLGLFAVWALASAGWAEDAERAVSESARTVMLTACALVALVAVRREHIRGVFGGVLAAITGVCAIAVLSRVEPSWFSADATGRLLPWTRDRLNYPLNYWNALAAFAAMGVPLGLGLALSSRNAWERGLSLAPIPLLTLTGYLTLSRGGIVALAIALVAMYLVAPDRLRWLRVAVVPAVGSGLLIAAAGQREAIRHALTNATAVQQGHEMIAAALVVAAAVAALGASSSLAERAWNAPVPAVKVARVTRRRWFAPLLVVLVLAAAAVTISQVDVSARWHSFKSAQTVQNSTSRLGASGGNGRWQLWEVAWDAVKEKPLTGIGMGSYSTYWARHAKIGGNLRNAHNLYIETLAELGVVGAALLFAALAAMLGGTLVAVRRASPHLQEALAGGFGALVVLAVSCVSDWDWQVTVLPVAFLVIAGASLSTLGRPRQREIKWRVRAPIAAVSLLAIGGLVVPLAAASSLRRSQEAAKVNAFSAASQRALDAGAIQPYAGTPPLQRALILERQRRYDEAAREAQVAARKSPQDWRPFVTLSRIEAERGDTAAAIAAFRRARTLNRGYVLLK